MTWLNDIREQLRAMGSGFDPADFRVSPAELADVTVQQTFGQVAQAIYRAADRRDAQLMLKLTRSKRAGKPVKPRRVK